MVVALLFHSVAAVVWTGGLFFACVVLWRSFTALEHSTRLTLLRDVLSRFLVWAWLSLIALFLSGVVMVKFNFGGFAVVGAYVRTMMMMAVLMGLVTIYLSAVPWRRFRRAVSSGDWTAAEASCRRINPLLLLNLVLGLATVIVGATGRYLG
jgi:uncharacterized membrane protein